MSADLATATKDLESQEIHLGLDSPSAQGQYLTSVTSIAARIPSFDHINIQGKRYLKIKSDEFIFARSSLAEPGNSSRIVIMPTDDSRLKAAIIPSASLI